MQSPKLDDGAVDEDFVAEVVDRSRSGKIRLLEHFLFVETHLFRGLQQHQDVSWGARRNQFVSDLRTERPKQVEMPDKKRQVSVIRYGVQRVDLQGKVSPVFEKLAHDGERQLALAELRHEGALVDLFVCVFVER